MSQRGPLTAVVTAVLGLTFGGVLAWRFYQTKRRRLPSVQKVADPVDALGSPLPPPPPEDCGSQAPPAVHVPTCEQLLAVRPRTVSCEEEWQQLWPRMQEELSLFPVLGFDCEWVKAAAGGRDLGKLWSGGGGRRSGAELLSVWRCRCRRGAKRPRWRCCRWPRTRACASWSGCRPSAASSSPSPPPWWSSSGTPAFSKSASAATKTANG